MLLQSFQIIHVNCVDFWAGFIFAIIVACFLKIYMCVYICILCIYIIIFKFYHIGTHL